MSKKVVNTLTIAVGAALLGSVSLANASAAFQITDLAGGYMQLTAGEGKCGEGKCGGDKKKKEGACGGDKAKEGACGGDKKKEGSCGGNK